eukprot:1419125-Prymnesium_polylepis.2
MGPDESGRVGSGLVHGLASCRGARAPRRAARPVPKTFVVVQCKHLVATSIASSLVTLGDSQTSAVIHSESQQNSVNWHKE